jgi:hypothetical protein
MVRKVGSGGEVPPPNPAHPSGDREPNRDESGRGYDERQQVILRTPEDGKERKLFFVPDNVSAYTRTGKPKGRLQAFTRDELPDGLNWDDGEPLVR